MITAVESANAHSTCWEVAELLRDDEPAARSRRASERLLQLAAGLPQGSHLSLVFAGDGAGAVSIRLHTDLDRADLAHLLDWVGEGVCRWVPFLGCGAHLTPLAEADPAVVELIPAFEAVPPEASLERPGLAPVLDAAAEDRVVLESRTPADPQLWPVPMTSDWMDLLTALTQAQAQVRVHLAPASPIEQQIIAAQARTSVQSRDPVVYSQYLGTPVRIRCFAGQAATMLSPRLRAVLTRFGVGLHLEPVDLSDPQTAAAWDGDETTLVGYVEPFGVASCYLKFPACGTETITCGVPTAEADIPPVAIARHTEAPAATEPDGPPARRVQLRLGQAIDWAGNRVDVTVTAEDLLLHTQVLGATGTGKSTLLAALAHQAAAAGLGVTVIESHGPLVERIVRELPDSAIDRTALVRSGDLRDSVPVNVLGGEHGELLSEVMLEVFRELYDPNSQGFLGPRFERIYSQAIAALRILFGDRASLAAIPSVIRDQKQVSELAEAVGTVDPALKSTLISELARLRDDNFAEIAGWVNAKFNRLVSRPEMRAILGTGDDAVDVTQVMDERGILLIDLAAPTLGPLSAQLLGEMWLAKHWAALASRADPLQPHLLIIDEAHLFGSGLLPRLPDAVSGRAGGRGSQVRRRGGPGAPASRATHRAPAASHPRHDQQCRRVPLGTPGGRCRADPVGHLGWRDAHPVAAAAGCRHPVAGQRAERRLHAHGRPQRPVRRARRHDGRRRRGAGRGAQSAAVCRSLPCHGPRHPGERPGSRGSTAGTWGAAEPRSRAGRRPSPAVSPRGLREASGGVLPR